MKILAPFKAILTVWILTIALSYTAHAAAPILSTDEQVIKNIGRIQVQLNRDFNRHSGHDKFYATIYNMNNDTFVNFHGACSQYIEIKVHAKDARKLNLEGYLKSRRGTDLPIGDILNIAKDELIGQCEQIEVIRVNFAPTHHTKEDYSYEGTMVKSNGWKLQDGIVKTQHDDKLEFEIRYRDMGSILGINHTGVCEQSPMLEIGPMFANNQEKALADPASMVDYLVFTRGANQHYLKKCPDTKEIFYKIKTIPEDHVCPPNQTCFLMATKDNAWKIEKVGFDFKEHIEDPAGSFKGLVNVLNDGKFDLLKDRDNFFAFFYESFILIYSDHCRAKIQDPVGREIQAFERRFDGLGGHTDTPEGPPRKVFIERTYADKFDAYYGSYKLWAVNMMMADAAKAMKANRGPGDTVRRSLGFFTGNYNDLEGMIRGNCSDPKIQGAYKNMLTYSQKRRPLTQSQKEAKKAVVAMATVLDDMGDSMGIKTNFIEQAGHTRESVNELFYGTNTPPQAVKPTMQSPNQTDNTTPKAESTPIHVGNDFTTTASGLKYKIISQGTAKKPNATDTVTVNYRGRLLDGTEFDSSYKRGKPATFPLTAVIDGWTEGLQLIGIGGKITLIIPANLGYGAQGFGNTIPPNSDLHFEIELLEIQEKER